MPEPRALALDLDGALGDTQRLWDDWIDDARRVLEVDPALLPTDRGEAARMLDEQGAGNWRVLLARFAEDRAPVYLRPHAEVSAALRRLSAQRSELYVFTDAPLELARIALAQLGATRRVQGIVAGEQALPRLTEMLDGDPIVVRTRAELVRLADPTPDVE